MKNAYLYPISPKTEKGAGYNPYIDDLIESLGMYFNFVNRATPSTTGVFNLLKHLSLCDYVFFNWAENIPEKKGGLAQAIFLLLFINTSKAFKYKNNLDYAQ